MPTVSSVHVEDQNRNPGSWFLRPGPAFNVVDVWGVNHQMKDSLFSLFVLQINEYIFKKKITDK